MIRHVPKLFLVILLQYKQTIFLVYLVWNVLALEDLAITETVVLHPFTYR